MLEIERRQQQTIKKLKENGIDQNKASRMF